MLYQYKNYSTPGSQGTYITYHPDYSARDADKSVFIATYGDTSYRSVPVGFTPPEQPKEIDWKEAVLTDEISDFLVQYVDPDKNPEAYLDCLTVPKARKYLTNKIESQFRESFGVFNDDMWFDSSLGFPCRADLFTLHDLQDKEIYFNSRKGANSLVYEDTPKANTVLFTDAKGNTQILTLDNIKKLLAEIATYRAAYEQEIKSYITALDQAASVKEMSALKVTNARMLVGTFDIPTEGTGVSGVNVSDGTGTSNVVTDIIFGSPLRLSVDTQHKVANVGLEHGMFEPRQSAGYLAYLGHNEQIITKKGSVATLWFDDEIIGGGAFIHANKSHKSFEIQDSILGDDPNVSGGENILISVNIPLVSKATSSGSVRVWLESNGAIFKDVNGNEFDVGHSYVKGDTFKPLRMTGVVKVKGIESFQVKFSSTFDDDIILIGDRLNGSAGIMIQELRPRRKTGMALVQYENDTDQRIIVENKYFGTYITTLNDISYITQNATKVKANTHYVVSDGLGIKALNACMFDVDKGTLDFTAEANTPLDVTVFQMFSHYDTVALRDKALELNVTAKSNVELSIGLAYNLAQDVPFDYERASGSVKLKNGWSLINVLDIPSDDQEHTLNKSVNVPADVKSLAVIAYPKIAEQMAKFSLKELRADVAVPFEYAFVRYVMDKGEYHLHKSTMYKHFTQTKHNYSSLRYSIGKSNTPLPFGEVVQGYADITLDPAKNQVQGSDVNFGQGVALFNMAGKESIEARINLGNDGNTQDTVEVWFSKFTDDGSIERIDDSLTTITIDANQKPTYHQLKAFTIDVTEGMRLGIQAKSKTGSSYIICTNNANPLIDIEITADSLKKVYGV